MRGRWDLIVLGMCLVVSSTAVGALDLMSWGEWSGYGGFEARGFTHDPLDPAQESNSWSVMLKPELYASWDDGRESFVFVPFVRWDAHDARRSHFDVRELFWEKVGNAWELRIGVGKVFWGVAESQHLVDIINQTDLIENPDGEDKLGQPLVNLTVVRDWGTLDFFVLPGFRERTFPGRRGRLRSLPHVDTDQVSYQSSREDTHVDFAARWSHYIGAWDFGLEFASPSMTRRPPRCCSAPSWTGSLRAGFSISKPVGAWGKPGKSSWRLGCGAVFPQPTRYLACVTTTTCRSGCSSTSSHSAFRS